MNCKKKKDRLPEEKQPEIRSLAKLREETVEINYKRMP